MKQPNAPGAAPEIQGYYAYCEKLPRPDWHPGHRDKEWIARWESGYKEAETRAERASQGMGISKTNKA